MNTIRAALFRGFALITLTISYVCLTYGKGDAPVVPIVRNIAWNDFINQIKFLPEDSPENSFDKEVLVIQKFLKEHETETSLEIYDVAVFRAIDQVRARLHKADKDMETLRNELSYREQQAKLGR